MKKIVRKIKKQNIKFLFATLLIAIIAISGGVALKGGKNTAAAEAKTKSMLGGTGLNLTATPGEYGISSNQNVTTSCSMNKNDYATISGCTISAKDTTVQRTITVTLRVKETGNNGIEREIKTVVYTVTITPNIINVSWQLPLGTKVNFLERLKSEGYIKNASITSSCPSSTNPTALPSYFNQSEGYGRCSYEAKANGSANVTFKTEGKTITIKVRTGVGETTPSASYVQRTVTYKTNVSNAEINSYLGTKSISSSKGYVEFYSSTSPITLPSVKVSSGYQFVGWVEGSDCSKATTMNQIPAGSNGIIMTACLTKVSSSSGNSGSGTPITVQFDGNYNDGATLTCNGTDTNSHAMVCGHKTTVGSKVKVPVAPTKTGYEFRGWSTTYDQNTCASNLVAGANATTVTAKSGQAYLYACWGAPSNSGLRQDACNTETRTGVTGSGSITHCIKIACQNGKIVNTDTNKSSITCAPGYDKVAKKTASGTCTNYIGSSCTGNGTGTCTDVYTYECVPSASLKFSKVSISLDKGKTDNLFNYLGYKGVNREDITFSYAKNSNGNDIVNISSDGTVTGKNTGRITVYAKAGASEATIDIVVGSGSQTCYNSLSTNEEHQAGESGIVRHCVEGVCSQYGGYAFNTTAISNYVINCVSGNKVSVLKTDTCKPLQGVCTPGDKVQCYQEWAWQCLPSDTNKKYYSVTYNYLNDAGDTQTVKVASGDFAPNTYITRNNYTFAGWYLGGQKFDFTTPITKDIVLNAAWTCNGSNCNNGEDSTGISDKDAPTCTLKVNKDGWATNKTLTVNINLGKNKLAQNYIEISKDNKKVTGWQSVPYYNITENGVYTVKVRDEKGLESSCKLEETRIDRTKPTVNGNWVQGETMQISLTGIDSQSGVTKYYLSQDPKDAPHQESSKWTTNSTFTVEEFGVYYAWVMDTAGNISNGIWIDDTKDITYAPDAVLSGLSAQAEGGVVEESLNPAQAMAFGLQRNYHVKQLATTDNLIAFSFSPNKLKYELTVRSSKISLYATLPNGASFVDGFEPKENQLLEYGLNTIYIKVKDSQGHIRTYTVLVNRVDDRSGVNLLSDLTVSGASFTFSPYKTEYTVKVAKGTTAVSINGTLSDSTSSYVEGFQPREITLEDDTTDVYVKVQSASGSVRTYTVHIVKEGTTESVPSTDVKGSNYLSSLTIAGANLDFDKNVLDYNVSVTNEVESVDIYAFAEDRAANVIIHGGGSLRVGENTATVTVTSTTGRSRTYTIRIIRKEDELGISNNTELSTLSVGGYDIKFKPDKLDYELKIDKEKTLVIMATPKSDRSNVYIVGNEDLSTFSTLKISVVAEDGSTSVYSIDISKDAWNTRIEIIIAAIGLTIAVGATVAIQIRRKKKRKALNQD